MTSVFPMLSTSISWDHFVRKSCVFSSISYLSNYICINSWVIPYSLSLIQYYQHIFSYSNCSSFVSWQLFQIAFSDLSADIYLFLSTSCLQKVYNMDRKHKKILSVCLVLTRLQSCTQSLF